MALPYRIAILKRSCIQVGRKHLRLVIRPSGGHIEDQVEKLKRSYTGKSNAYL
jgi:hypothetical protein